MRGGNALFLIIWMHGLEREGGAPVPNINHINGVWFCLPVLSSGTGVQGFACELSYMASSKGGLFFLWWERTRHGEMETPDPKSGVKAIDSWEWPPWCYRCKGRPGPLCTFSSDGCALGTGCTAGSKSPHNTELSLGLTGWLCHREWMWLMASAHAGSGDPLWPWQLGTSCSRLGSFSSDRVGGGTPGSIFGARVWA